MPSSVIFGVAGGLVAGHPALEIALPLTKLVYTVSEACRLLSIGRTKLYCLVKSGRLISVKLDGRRLFRREDLLAFVATLSTEGGL